MSHPCNHYSCCENYHGECYGEGCKLNPAPNNDNNNDNNNDDNNNTQED